MIKISASFTKKVPGDEPYSSDGVHLGVEVELPDRFLTDKEQFSATVRRLFQQARDEVEQQVGQGRPHLGVDPSSNGNKNSRVVPEPRRNGHHAQLASKRQLDFLLSLARRNGNLSPQDLMDEAGVSQLAQISKNQASSLIERFSPSVR